MCAASTRAEASGRWQGRVERRRLGQGSKSEHHAIVLVEDGGTVWKLRRLGGNPFRDPVLDALEGCRLDIEGRAEGSTLFFEHWQILAPGPDDGEP